jgi:pyruvate kinase
MDYEIVATLGPGSNTEELWQKMRSAGATAFRLNTSHLSLVQLQAWLGRLIPFLSSLETMHFLVLDLQGSKWRLGQIAPFSLVDGQIIRLIFAASSNQRDTLPVPHQDFFKAASVSGRELVLNDARIHLWVESAGQGWIKARVLRGGLISPNKGITFQASQYRQEALSEKDQAVFEQTHANKFCRFALSYVKDTAEMIKYRQLLGPSAYLVAKLERGPAIDEAVQIAEYSDELWLCRGDLGAELGIKSLAEKVYQFSSEVKTIRAPVLMAGQVFEHMTEQAEPTRSEICYLHDTLAIGYRGFVLSDETAIGRYPIQACQAAALFRA